MSEEPRQLALVSQARKALAEAKTIDEVKDIRDKAEAMRLYMRQRDESLEAQNMAAEIKLWAERKAGELLATMPKRSGGDAMKARSSDRSEVPSKLADIGISHNESSQWQAIASIPEEQFTRHIEEAKAEERPLTSSGMYREARAYNTPTMAEAWTAHAEREAQREAKASTNGNGHAATQTPPQLSEAERHRKHLLKCLDEIDDLTRAMAAEVRHGGYGGYRATLELLGKRDGPRALGKMETLDERLQEWITQARAYFDEG